MIDRTKLPNSFEFVVTAGRPGRLRSVAGSGRILVAAASDRAVEKVKRVN